MVNIRRRKKQAHENMQIILEKFHECIIEKKELCSFSQVLEKVNSDNVNSLIDHIEEEIIGISTTLEPNWAIPMLIELIGNLYYGDYKNFSSYGPTFKRALAYLWKNSFIKHDNEKSIDRLVNLLTRCFVLQTLFSSRRVFLTIPDYYFSFSKGNISIPNEFITPVKKLSQSLHGRGKRLRVAKVNSKLMSNPKEYYNALINVLNGADPQSIGLFKNTFFYYIPGISNLECQKFWKHLHLMYCLFLLLSMSADNTVSLADVVILPEFAVYMPKTIASQEDLFQLFWRRDWFDQQDSEQFSDLIVNRPILRISESDYFATSLALLGDSINNFIEQQIMKTPARDININLPDAIFKNAISEPFEQECIEYLRKNNFLAGKVTQSGTWITQCENIKLESNSISLYGEIDVLAYHSQLNMLLLIECKVLGDIYTLRTYKNLISKLNDDSEAFRYKMQKKSEWSIDSFFNYSGIKTNPQLILLTDIPFPVSQNEDNVILTHFDSFMSFIKKAIANIHPCENHITKKHK